MKSFIPLYEPVSDEKILTLDCISRLLAGKRPSDPNETISREHFFLVCGYSEGSREQQVTIALGVKETTQIFLAGGYLPVSERTYQRKKRKDSVWTWVNGLAALCALLGESSLIAWWGWKYSIPEAMGIPVALVAVPAFFSLILIKVSSVVMDPMEVALSREVVGGTLQLNKMGVRDNLGKAMKPYIYNADILGEIERRKQWEK